MIKEYWVYDNMHFIRYSTYKTLEEAKFEYKHRKAVETYNEDIRLLKIEEVKDD